MRPARVTVFAAIAAFALACNRSDGGSDGFTVRDSAGVRVVDNTAPAWRSGEGWSLDSTMVAIGTADGAEGQQLHRVSAAVRLGDGTLVIANGGSRQLLRYDARGTFLGASGGEGEGPGEFRALEWIGRARADSIITWDRGLGRITVFSPAGVYARDYKPALTENPMAIVVKGALEGGRLLMARGASFIAVQGTSGVQRQPITGWLLDSLGHESQSFGPFPGEAVLVEPARTPGSVSRMPVLLGPSTLFTTGRDAVHIVDTDSFAIRTYTPDARLTTIARRPHAATPVQPDDIAAAIDALLENVPPVPAIREGMRVNLERVPPPQNLPAVDALRADSDGNVWVQAGTRPKASDATWSVFDPRGRWLGDIVLPANVQLLDIGRDYVVARDQDDLDVERIRVLRLNKSRAGG